MFRFAICCFVLGLLLSQANACLISPTSEQADSKLRALINNSDYVFVAQVDRIIRKRWGPDDEMGEYETRILELKREGQKISDYHQHRLDFSDATARIYVHQWLKEATKSEASVSDGQVHLNQDHIDIDLLNPGPGIGSCYKFPLTCPWDTKPGDFVAVAVGKQEYAPWLALVCVKVDRAFVRRSTNNVTERNSSSADEMLWPFIENARTFARARNDAKHKKK